MRVHHLPLNLNQVNLYSSQAAEKAAAAQRSLEIRNQLREKALQLDEPADSFECLNTERESDREAQRRRQNQKPAAQPAAPQDDGSEDLAEEPMSFWV